MAVRKDVSIKMIAENCGVSIATVSRVMNNDSKVSVKTRNKVLAEMDKCGYKMSAPTSSTVKKIGIVIDTQVNDYYRALLIQLCDTFNQYGIQTISASLEYKKDTLPDILKTIYDCNISGVILISCDYTSIKNMIDPRLPHVWIDCADAPDQTENICQVQSEQYVSGVLAAQELYRKGSTNPIYLGGSSSSHRMKDRFAGFQAEYKKHGIDIGEDRIIQTPPVRDAFEESKKTIRYLISSGFEFDGVFAISDWRALGTYLALDELGIRVPEDIKIIGYDGVSVASRAILNITSVQQDIPRIADSACDLMFKQMNGETIKNKNIVVPTSILSGQTI